jgi:hypothetical protein
MQFISSTKAWIILNNFVKEDFIALPGKDFFADLRFTYLTKDGPFKQIYLLSNCRWIPMFSKNEIKKQYSLYTYHLNKLGQNLVFTNHKNNDCVLQDFKSIRYILLRNPFVFMKSETKTLSEEQMSLSTRRQSIHCYLPFFKDISCSFTLHSFDLSCWSKKVMHERPFYSGMRLCYALKHPRDL